MKIICTEQEKEKLIEMFNDGNGKCPFGGDSPFCNIRTDCSACITLLFPIEWEVIK